MLSPSPGLDLGCNDPCFPGLKKSILGQRLQELGRGRMQAGFILFLSAGSNTNLDAKSILPLRAGLCIGCVVGVCGNQAHPVVTVISRKKI